MASDQQFVDYVLEQMENAGAVTAKKMFGEYGLYLNGKFFASVCDNKLFIKPTDAGRSYIGEVTEAPPYNGAKPNFLIEEKIEDRAWLCKLVQITAAALPTPKPRKRKPKK
ncbi:MAG: TfoX/Sxy family protein [Bacteroidota bacterium]